MKHLLKHTHYSHAVGERDRQGQCVRVYFCAFPYMNLLDVVCGETDRPRGIAYRRTGPSPAVTHNTCTPWSCHLKLLQWVWETFLALRLLKTHTTHSSECILGTHSLILQHMQTHICIPVHGCSSSHKNKMTEPEVPFKPESAASSSSGQHKPDQ